MNVITFLKEPSSHINMWVSIFRKAILNCLPAKGRRKAVQANAIDLLAIAWMVTDHVNRIPENVECHTSQIVCLCPSANMETSWITTEPNEWLGYIAFTQWMRSILMNFKELVPGSLLVQTLTFISVSWLQWRNRLYKSITLNASSYHQLICFLWRSALMPTVCDSSHHHCWHKFPQTVWPLEFSLLSMNHIKYTTALILIFTFCGLYLFLPVALPPQSSEVPVQSKVRVTVCTVSPVLPLTA